MIGVKFNGKHSYDYYGLVLHGVSLSAPEPKLSIVEVPGSSEPLDMTEALGTVTYNQRELKFAFYAHDNNIWWIKNSELLNALHGQKVRIILDDDETFYYIGRLKYNSWSTYQQSGHSFVEFTCIVNPYKYEAQDNLGPWLWDPFNFEVGIVREYGNIEVTAGNPVAVNIYGRGQQAVPTITASSAMTVEFEGTEYQLYEGKNRIYTMIIKPGENIITFKGSGTVSIDYQGGSL